MNIIIVGCGKVGTKLVEKLSLEQEHNITVIDLKHTTVQSMVNQYDTMGVVGSGISHDTLIEAGISESDMLIAITGSDELNLLTCLMAKKLGNCKTVARVRQPEYSKEIHHIREELGLAMIINPEQAAATEIARILRFPSAVQIDTFSKGKIEILKFRIPDDSILNGMAIKELAPKLNCDILVCGVERNEDAFIPDGNFCLESGDYVSILCSISSSSYFFKKIGLKTNSVKDTIIVGGGTTAYYLASQLLQTGIAVKIIEQNLERCEELCKLLPKATIINADGSDSHTLMEEGLSSTESFVTLTNMDEENVMITLFAKSKSKGKLVTKINRIEYNDVISSLNLDTLIYPKNITADYIVRFVRAKNKSRGSNIETMHLILGGKAEALEFKIKENSPISITSIENLPLKKNTLIACIYRNGQLIIPRGRDIIQKGDIVIVVTTETGCNSIENILR